MERIDAVLDGLYDRRRQAEEEWTPGEACGTILGHLNRMEEFSDSYASARQAQSRLRWLADVLARSLERAAAIGLDPTSADGVFTALALHDCLLSRTGSIHDAAVKQSRELAKLEILYLTTSSHAE